MRLAIVGDIHGDIDGMYRFLLTECGQLDAVIQVGDFGLYLPPEASHHDKRHHKDYLTYQPELGVIYPYYEYYIGSKMAPFMTYVCPGNHESWTVASGVNLVSNLHIMEDGAVTTLADGTRVGAIWGNFSWKSWKNPQRIHTARRNYGQNFSYKAMHILKESVDKLAQENPIDILITHDCPHGMAPSFGQPPEFIKQQLGLDPDEQAAGCPGFNDLHMKLAPKYHFFGHHHKYARMSPKDYPVQVIALDNFNVRKKTAVCVLDTEEL